MDTETAYNQALDDPPNQEACDSYLQTDDATFLSEAEDGGLDRDTMTGYIDAMWTVCV